MLDSEFLRGWKRLHLSYPITLLLSGGGDSVALFHLLRRAQIDFRALHFVHDGKGDFASRSLTFCRDLCAHYCIALEHLPVLGQALVSQGDLSWEAACRQLRYAALKGKAGSFLTGHTLDDQAETVIMRMLRGAGLAGLAGIRRERRDGVVRPLLDIERSRLRTFLLAHGFDWLDDPTNLDGNERARVRHGVMRALEAHNPRLKQTLSRTAHYLSEDEDYLTQTADSWLRQETHGAGDNWEVSSLQALARPILWRVIRHIWKCMSDTSRRPLATLFEEVITLIRAGTNEGRIDFPGGWSLQILGSRLWVMPSQTVNFYRTSTLDTPEFLQMTEVENGEGFVGWTVPSSEWVVRNRRAGDTYQGKCVKKILAATKQPPWVRDRWPLLDIEDKIVAIWGLRGLPWVFEKPNIWLKFSPERLRCDVRKSL